MSLSRLTKPLLAAALALGLGACVIIPSSYKSEAFGKSKRFAVVSVAAAPEVHVSHAGAGQTISGLVKAISKDSGYRNDAGKIFADTTPLIVRELEKSRRFTLVPSQSVLQAKTYRSIEADDPAIPLSFGKKMLVAPGYKYFSSEDKLARLARELNVDAVIVVSVNYMAGFTGAQVGGVISGGVHKGNVLVTVYAVDRNGGVVWKDGGDATSDNSIGGIGESVNFTRLHPLLIEATRNATRKLMEKMEDKVASL